MKCSGKMWIKIKSHKKAMLHSPSLENTNLKKVTAIIKIRSKRKLSKIFEFSILGIGQNGKLGNFEIFFLLKA